MDREFNSRPELLKETLECDFLALVKGLVHVVPLKKEKTALYVLVRQSVPQSHVGGWRSGTTQR